MNWWYHLKKCFSLYPGFLRPVSAPFLHDYYQARRRERSFARAALDGVIFILFQLWVPFRARSVARRFGLGGEWAKNASGIGRRRFADPNDIAVFSITADADLDRYMRRFEYAEVSKRINPAGWRSDCALSDKARFAARCAQHGLPHPPLLARKAPGGVEISGLPDRSSLAVKPIDGQGGKGFEIVEFADWQGADEPRFRAFLARALGHRHDAWIVQPRVEGHPELRDITLNALSTARVTTMRNEVGDYEIVTSVLRFSSNRESLVDNLASGGLLAPVDPESGMIGAACYGRRVGDIAIHPATGAAIAGRVIPQWAELRDLVERAHRHAFAEYVMIGWDVGLAEGGPVLIEGNAKPGLFAAQRGTREGIGATRFGALIRHHLRVGPCGLADRP